MSKKATIVLAEPWTYHTIAKTIDFPAGKHTVDAEIAEAAPQIELKAETNGNTGNASKAGKARTDNKGEG